MCSIEHTERSVSKPEVFTLSQRKEVRHNENY